MTTNEIATKLAELCAKEQYETAQKELYGEDCISIEPMESPSFKKEIHGLQNIIEKGHQFEKMVEKMHSTKVSTPLVTANTIAFTLSMDVTMKGRPRETMSELCVYEVKNGKIIKEQFFM